MEAHFAHLRTMSQQGSIHLKWGYQREHWSQWGGDARYDTTIDKWILFAAEMYDQCGTVHE